MINRTKQDIIKELTFDVKKGVFGTYDALTHEAKNLEISETQVVEHLFDNLNTFDFDTLLEDYKELKKEDLNYRIKSEMYCIDVYDIDSTLELLQEIKTELEELENLEIKDFEDLEKYFEISDYQNRNNSYNWSASATFDYYSVFVNDIEIVAVKFHRYGDVRGNYTDEAYFECSMQEFLECLLELRVSETIEINGNTLYIDYNILSEYGVFSFYSDDLNIDIEVYINSNFEDFKDFKVEVIEKLCLAV